MTTLIRNPVHVVEDNFRRPQGWPGRAVGRLMAVQHRSLTKWTLTHMRVAATDRVLDVGCGGGTALGLLSEATPAGSVVGVDYSEAMVRQAAVRHAAAVAAGRLEVRTGDAMALPYPDDSFDQVSAIETFYFWPDPLQGLREARRVLRPGGQLAVTLEMSKEAAAQTSRYRRALSERYARRAAQLGQRVCSGADLTEMMRDAGFREARYVTEPNRSLGWVCALARA